MSMSFVSKPENVVAWLIVFLGIGLLVSIAFADPAISGASFDVALWFSAVLAGLLSFITWGMSQMDKEKSKLMGASENRRNTAILGAFCSLMLSVGLYFTLSNEQAEFGWMWRGFIVLSLLMYVFYFHASPVLSQYLQTSSPSTVKLVRQNLPPSEVSP
jgi:uncharacterized membrane protein SirB2